MLKKHADEVYLLLQNKVIGSIFKSYTEHLEFINKHC